MIAREICVERQAAALLEQRELSPAGEQLRAAASAADQIYKLFELADAVAAAYEPGISAD